MRWVRKSVFDYHEYWTEAGVWKYCIAGKGHDWTLRGWKDGVFKAYQNGSTLSGLKAVAREIK